MMRKGLPTVLVFLTFLPSCATAPGSYAFERSQPYGHPYPDVWAAVVGVATTNLPVSAIHENEGVGTITTLQHALSVSDGHHDCGSGGLEYRYGDHLATVSLVVRALDAGGAAVTVNTHFSAVPFAGFSSRMSDASRVSCNSTGTLEADIQRRVRETLERVGSR